MKVVDTKTDHVDVTKSLSEQKNLEVVEEAKDSESTNRRLSIYHSLMNWHEEVRTKKW